MAADFNAGSIEGTLGLDTTPFKAGLAMARAQADDFASQKYQASIGLGTAEFDAKRDLAETELTKFDHTKVSAKADLDISEAVSKYEILKHVLDAGGLGQGVTSVGMMTGKIFAMTGAVLGLLSILGPASGVVAGFGVAAAVAFGGIAISLGLFAAAAKSAFGEITAANKAGITLTGWAGTAQRALKGLTDGWTSLVNSVKPQLFQDMAVAFNVAGHVLSMLSPLLRTTAQGVGLIIGQIDILTRSKLFSVFLQQLQQFMGGFLSGAGPVIRDLLASFMHIFIALEPLMAIIGHGLETAAAQADKFTRSLQHGGISPFIDYVRTWMPVVLHLVGSVFSGIENLLQGLTPLAGPAIKFLEALVQAIGHLHLAPLARGFGDLFDALRPILPVLGQLVNTILGPLGRLLSGIAHDAVEPLSNSLSSNLHPALRALHDILHAIVQPLSEFAGSIANLANPTGVHLVGKLLQGLDGIVRELVGPFGRLAVALESVVDDGLNAIIPLLGPFLAGIKPLAGLLAAVAGGLADILSHKAVVDTLLALYGAFKLLEIIEFIGGLLGAVSTALTIFAAAAEEGMIIETIGTIAPGVAAGLTLIGGALDFAMGPLGLVIIGIAALAAGLIYAYKHSETFRNIVNGAFTAVRDIARNVFDWLKHAVMDVVNFVHDHWQLLLAILTGPIGLAVYFLMSHWNTIRNGFTSLMSDVKNAVQTGINDVVGWFTALPGRILALGGQMLNAGRSLMGHIFSGLESAASSVGGFAANIAQSIWHELESVLNNVLPHRLSINKGPIHVSVPLFPYLATGGVTNGPTPAMIGDNPGGQEAVVPLDKYDIPRKGDVEAIAGRAQAANETMIALLSRIVQHLAGQKQLDPDEFAQALGPVMGKMSQAQIRAMVQAARAA